MNLELRPASQSLFPRRALLLRGSHPAQWAAELTRLNVLPEAIVTYAVPGTTANELYGCVLLFPEGKLPTDVGPNAVLCLAEIKILLPERTTYRPLLAGPALTKLHPEGLMLLHPHLGTVLLDVPVDWQQLMELPEAALTKPRRPAAGVAIPESLQSLRREVAPEALLAELEQTGNAPDEKLPFDLKKLMAGNKREMEKYLRYLEAHPDKALKLAIPLDLAGTSRGDRYGRFSFGGGGGWFNGFGGWGGNAGSKPANWIWAVLCVAVILMRAISDRDKHTVQQPTIAELPVELTPAGALYLEQYGKWNSTRPTYQGSVVQDSAIINGVRVPTASAKAAIQGVLKDSVVAIFEKRITTELPLLLATRNLHSGKTAAEQRLQDSLRAAYGIDSAGLAEIDRLPLSDLSPTVPEQQKPPHRPFSLTALWLPALLAGSVLTAAWGVSFVRTRRRGGSAFGLAESDLSGWQKGLFYLLLFVLLTYVIAPAVGLLGLGLVLVILCPVLTFALYRLFGQGLSSANS